MNKLRFLFHVVLLFTLTQGLAADTLYLAIQPVLPRTQLEKAYTPLASYLSKATGYDIKIRPSINFLGYWETMRQSKDTHLFLDAAHFTDFRIKKLNYEVLAKINDTVSFTLVTAENLLLFDTSELIGIRLATIGSPSLSSVRLSEMYPNPLRQPYIVDTNNYIDALEQLQSGKVKAAFIPTPMIRGNSSVNTLVTTDPVPHMGFSASPEVNNDTKQAIKQALINAGKTPEGKAMLDAVNLSGFEAATNNTYDGYGQLLQGMWGY